MKSFKVYLRYIRRKFHGCMKRLLFGSYTYSETNSVDSFDVTKYADRISLENTQYVYDSVGRIMAIINAPTKKKAIWECKKYIIQRRLGLIPVIHYWNNSKVYRYLTTLKTKLNPFKIGLIPVIYFWNNSKAFRFLSALKTKLNSLKK